MIHWSFYHDIHLWFNVYCFYSIKFECNWKLNILLKRRSCYCLYWANQIRTCQKITRPNHSNFTKKKSRIDPDFARIFLKFSSTFDEKRNYWKTLRIAISANFFSFSASIAYTTHNILRYELWNAEHGNSQVPLPHRSFRFFHYYSRYNLPILAFVFNMNIMWTHLIISISKCPFFHFNST